ncbi:17327_t:CDS:1, partial [Funneliformis geosporum]
MWSQSYTPIITSDIMSPTLTERQQSQRLIPIVELPIVESTQSRHSTSSIVELT